MVLKEQPELRFEYVIELTNKPTVINTFIAHGQLEGLCELLSDQNIRSLIENMQIELPEEGAPTRILFNTLERVENARRAKASRPAHTNQSACQSRDAIVARVNAVIAAKAEKIVPTRKLFKGRSNETHLSAIEEPGDPANKEDQKTIVKKQGIPKSHSAESLLCIRERETYLRTENDCVTVNPKEEFRAKDVRRNSM